ncbi:glycoside hydrolase family 19 protein [Thauera sp.]|uniref:glycoside hydrolase family 19 protein n=1 Tax=Thauera sp. TaxID=1905334 RepID=UPI0039E21DCF
MITAAVLQALGATERNAALYVEPLRIAAERYHIDTAQRLAHWLAQIAHESAGFSAVVENLNYSAEGLARTWPQRYALNGAPNATARILHLRPADIANLTYADRMGNGPVKSGDGWRYRGRGLIQITGRDRYRQCGIGLGLDLLAHPEMLEEPLYAALSAGWYWHTENLNPQADRDDVRAVTKGINGGYNGLADRAERTKAAARALAGTGRA